MKLKPVHIVISSIVYDFVCLLHVISTEIQTRASMQENFLTGTCNRTCSECLCNQCAIENELHIAVPALDIAKRQK
jgi:hypothetical protein